MFLPCPLLNSTAPYAEFVPDEYTSKVASVKHYFEYGEPFAIDMGMVTK